MNDSIINLYVYILLWSISFIFVYRDKKAQLLNKYVIGAYLLYSIMAFFLFDIQGLSVYKPLSLFPFIYLFLTVLLFISPLLYIKKDTIQFIEQPNKFLFNSISLFIIIITVLQIPFALSDGINGIYLLLVDSSYGDDMYNQMAENYENGGDGSLNFIPLFSNAFSTLGLLMYIYSLVINKSNSIITFGLSVTVVINILSPLLSGSRTIPILNILTLIALFTLFKNWMPRKTVKRLQYIGIGFLFFAGILISALTISRMSSKDNDVLESVLSYGGQAPLYFNNYGLNANGTRNGDRVLLVFKKALGLDVPNNFVERRSKYSNMYLNDANFSTFVGDFTLDFGPIFAFVILSFLALICRNLIFIKGGVLMFHQTIILFFIICTVIQGGMYLWPFSDTGGNLKLIVLFLTYILFKYYGKKSTNNRHLFTPIPPNSRE